MPKASLKSQAIYLFAGKAVAFIILGLTPIVLVRILSPSQFGSYKQVLFIYAALLPIIKLQLPESLYYFYPRMKNSIDQLLSQTLTLLFLAGLLGTGLFLILALHIDILPSGLSKEFVWPVAIFLFIETMAILVEHLFVLEKKPILAFGANVAGSLARMVLIVSAALLYKKVIVLVYALIVLGILRLSGTLIYILRKYTVRLWTIRKTLFKEQMKYTLPLAISAIIGVVGSKIDQGIISGAMSPKDFAIYAVGSIGIMNAVKVLFISLGNVFLPRFGELIEEHKKEDVRLLWHKMIMMNAVVTIPLVTFCMLYAEQIISILYTPQYVSAANLWRLNLTVLLIQILGFGYIPRAMGKTGAILTGNCLRFVTSTALSLILIFKIGLLGGAIAFVVGFWVDGIVQVMATKNGIQASLKTLLPWGKLFRLIMASLLCGILLLFISRFQISPIVQVVVGGLFYCSTVALLMPVFNIVSVDEIKDFLNIKKNSKKADAIL